jgi:hypothetical protein
MPMWALDEVFIGYYVGPTSDIEGVAGLKYLPWIDPTHPP